MYSKLWKKYINGKLKKRYYPACENLWKDYCLKKNKGKCDNCDYLRYAPITDRVIYDHLTGKQTIGCYVLLLDNTCWFCAVDFDGPNWMNESIEFMAVCEVQGTACYLERSRSGNGGHVWIFFSKPVQAWKVRMVAIALLREAQVISDDSDGAAFDWIFPAQDCLSAAKPLGSLIALPLQGDVYKQGNAVFVDPENECRPHPSQLEFLKTIQKIDEFQLDAVIADFNLKSEPPRAFYI